MLGRFHKSQNLVPFSEIEAEIRKLFIEEKEGELRPGRKTRQERIQEELNASAFREFEEQLENEVQMEKEKWERRRVEKLNQSLNKTLNGSFSSPKTSQNNLNDPVAEFKPELFKTKVLIEKIKALESARTVLSTSIIENQSVVKPKTPLHKTDSVISNEEKAALFAPSGDGTGLSTPVKGPAPLKTPVATKRASISTSEIRESPVSSAPTFPVAASRTLETTPVQSYNPDIKKCFDDWIHKMAVEHKNLRTRLTKYRKEPENAKFCNSLKRNINDQIDVTTSKDFNDIRRISMAHNFFESLLNGQTIKGSADDSEIRLDAQNEIALEYTVAWICERYTKLVASDGDLIESVATIFTMLVRLRPFIRDRLVSLVVSNCVLLRMNPDEILKKVIELGNVSAEESSVWLPEEGNKVKLLLKTCFYTTNVDGGELGSSFLINQLLKASLNSPPIPISTCFVLTSIVQTYGKALLKMADLMENIQKIKNLIEMDWNNVLAPFKERIPKAEAWNVLESRQNVCLQQLKSALNEVVAKTG
ncbi:unnamed protein product [Bursaphelenchus xylophilus]|uniref:(pine wood nematode) hypothetical protein n=1 Tax=Bursaphelenchus xylophilus TaxID=6326 RepID=A0A1I7RI61_BURXY|nr:unnamed protein product [Bursaphelenchus xylophilus]CAG9115133.1 unnamed protein product [Bursaphelenchus xylophilus]